MPTPISCPSWPLCWACCLILFLGSGTGDHHYVPTPPCLPVPPVAAQGPFKSFLSVWPREGAAGTRRAHTIRTSGMVLVTVTSERQHYILSIPQPESGAPKTSLTSFLVQSGVPTRTSPWEAAPQSEYVLSTPRGRVPAWGRAGPPAAGAQGRRSPSSHHSTRSPSAGTLGPAEPVSPGSAPPQPQSTY